MRRFKLRPTPFLKLSVVARDDEGEGDPSPVYTVTLSTPLSKYERDRPAPEAVLMFWCLQPPE